MYAVFHNSSERTNSDNTYNTCTVIDVLYIYSIESTKVYVQNIMPSRCMCGDEAVVLIKSAKSK